MEIEIRAFLEQDRFQELMQYFLNNAVFEGVKNQETYYFDTKTDVRLQRWDDGAKIWYKAGNMHDEVREELEVKFEKRDFEKMLKIFTAIGLETKIKWFRIRHKFDWDGIKVFMDYTIGYGYIIEMEKQGEEKEKKEVLKNLKDRFKELKIEQTPKEIFDEKYKYYENNWKELLKN